MVTTSSHLHICMHALRTYMHLHTYMYVSTCSLDSNVESVIEYSIYVNICKTKVERRTCTGGLDSWFVLRLVITKTLTLSVINPRENTIK